jgi:hypothetical protein
MSESMSAPWMWCFVAKRRRKVASYGVAGIRTMELCVPQATVLVSKLEIGIF